MGVIQVPDMKFAGQLRKTTDNYIMGVVDPAVVEIKKTCQEKSERGHSSHKANVDVEPGMSSHVKQEIEKEIVVQLKRNGLTIASKLEERTSMTMGPLNAISLDVSW